MKRISNKDIVNAYRSVREFNEIAGQLDNPAHESISLQLSLIFEELTETIEALEGNDPAELLKESCDTFIVVAGLLQKLECAGFNVAAALSKICDNNMSKFVPVTKTIMFDDVYSPYYYVNEKYGCHVLKNKDGKIVKHSGYEKVTGLEEFCPREFN